MLKINILCLDYFLVSQCCPKHHTMALRIISDRELSVRLHPLWQVCCVCAVEQMSVCFRFNTVKTISSSEGRTVN